MRITSRGFQFLLQSVQVQIWAFLQQYLDATAVCYTSYLQLSSFNQVYCKIGTRNESG